MDLRREGDSWKVLAHEILPMTANTAPADPEILQSMKAFGETISKADKVLMDLKSPVPADRIFLAYTKALAGLPGTDVVLYSKESIRSDWNAGDLRASEVFNSLPWTTGIVQMTLTPEQIAKAGELIGLVASPSPSPAGSSLTVTTSEFFGRIIATRLGLDFLAIRVTEHTSEYDFFVKALESSPEVLTSFQKNNSQNQPGDDTP
jgi:2',3'-cyclic-nucleotide 2'-phosphodiesterase (5'-nucleotidase family)